MKLYDFHAAPSPRRVRIFIAEKGLDIPLEQIDLGTGEQFSDEYRAINPGCTVPCLETDDGDHISECLPICAYLEMQHPEPALMGETALEKARVLMWNHIVEMDGIGGVGESFRNFSKGFRERALTGALAYGQIPDLVERGRARAIAFFDRVEGELSSYDHLAGERYSMADITLLVTVDFAKWIKFDALEGRSALASWYARVSERPSHSA